MSKLLPLFPLDLVLLPGTALPLHIFEPRYREMIGECLETKQAFGVVRTLEEGLAELGCTAEIESVVKRYEDGRLDILTSGHRRFELIRVNEVRAFAQAEVLYFDDQSDDALPAERIAEAVALQRELLQLGGLADETNPQHRQLSFHLAGSLPLDLDFKQALLAMRSERERLDKLIEYYEQLLPKLRRVLKNRTKSAGNGHVM